MPAAANKGRTDKTAIPADRDAYYRSAGKTLGAGGRGIGLEAAKMGEDFRPV